MAIPHFDIPFRINSVPINLLINPSFEIDTDLWAALNCTKSRVTDQAKYGVAAGKATGTEVGSQYLQHNGSVLTGSTAGLSFTGSTWAKGEGSSIGKTFSFYMIAFRPGYTETMGVVSNVILSAEWKRISQTINIVDDAITMVYYYAYLNPGAIGDIHYIDGARIELGSVATPFEAIGRGALVVEQDSEKEILNCVETILRYEKGQRPELLDFGIPDVTFSEPSIDVSPIQQAVTEWEPRIEAKVEKAHISDLIHSILTEVNLERN